MMIHRTDALPTPESDEQYVRDVIDSAMSGTRPPHDLPSAALARGRRLRTRRRLTIASGAVTAGVLAAVAGPWLLSGTAGDGQFAGSDSVATEPPPSLSTAVPGQVPPGYWQMPATEMVSTVEAILPDGITVTDPGPLEADTEEGGPASGYIVPVVTGPGGVGQVNVMLYPAPSVEQITPSSDPGSAQAEVQPGGADGDISCPGNLAARAQCDELTAPDGTLVGRRSSTTFGEVTTFEVVLRREGGTVYAAAANTLDRKWGRQSPASAETPPLTLAQLEALVRNDAWTSYRP